MKQIPAIVLDSNQRSSLAVTRSLGRYGIPVINGAESIPSLASSSRYSSDSFLYPSPENYPDEFIKILTREISRFPQCVLIPTTDITVAEVLSHRESFPETVQIPFVTFEKYEAASDKINLFRLASRLNIPIPKTLFSEDFSKLGNMTDAASALGFPLVIKPGRSRYRSSKGWISTRVQYARDLNELTAFLDSEVATRQPFMLQEKIVGPGSGIFLLLRMNEVIAKFSHRRIREKPPSGGVSVVCESIPLPEAALQSATTLLKRLNWHGVAMVEFKMDSRDQSFRLMEVNARFWGSLQLAISAGVDFPYLLYSMAVNQNIQSLNGYSENIKSRWELGDLDHLLIRMKSSGSQLNLPPGSASKAGVFFHFLKDFLNPQLKSEVFRWRDPQPFLYECRQYLKNL